MNTPRMPRAVSVAEVFFRITYGLFWLVAGLLVLLAVVLPFSGELQDEFCRIPIKFSLKSAPAEFIVGDTAYPTSVTRAEGYLQIPGGPLIYDYVELLTLMLVLAVGLFVTRQILKLIGRVKMGEFFISDNVSAMRRISLAIFGLWGIKLIVGVITSLIIGKHLASDTLAPSGIVAWLEIEGLTFPLLLLVLAEVFRAGSSLKEDQDLTV